MHVYRSWNIDELLIRHRDHTIRLICLVFYLKSMDASSLEVPSKTGLNTAEKSVKHHSTSCLSNIGGFFLWVSC